MGGSMKTLKSLKKTGLALTVTTATTSVFANISEPEVLHTFTSEGDMTQVPMSSLTDLGKNPHLPPVYNSTTGKLYGVTPAGGAFMGLYGVNYSFTPNAPEPDYQGISSNLNVLNGFYPGLTVDGNGNVFGGAKPFNPGLPGPTESLLFKWTEAESLSNAFPDINPNEEFGAHFDLRGLPAVDADNNVYFGGGVGTNGMSLFRRTEAGLLEQLVDFSLYEQSEGNKIFLKGQYPAAVIISETDNAIYGLAVKDQGADGAGNPQDVPGDSAVGTLFKVSKSTLAADGTSPVEVLHTFAEESEGLIKGNDSDQQALVEVGEWIYGTTTKAIWRIKKADTDSFELLHTFGSGNVVAADEDGATPHGPIVLAKDGNIYGTTETSFSSESSAKAGTIFKIEIKGDNATYSQVHQFNIETQGAFPKGLNTGPTNGGFQTLFGAAEFGGNAGDTVGIHDATGLGTVYSVQVKLSGSLQISLDKTEITLGESVTLTWSSEYLDACTGVDDLTGDQSPAGSVTLTPDHVAVYDYSLQCTDLHGDAIAASVSLNVKAADVTPDPDPTPDDGRSTGGSSSSDGGSFSLATLVLMLSSLLIRRRNLLVTSRRV